MPKVSKVDEILRKLATEPLNTTDDIYNAIEEAKAKLCNEVNHAFDGFYGDNRKLVEGLRNVVVELFS